MTNINKEDVFYMKKTLELASKGQGLVSPNPLVGAVLVKDGVIISEGYHQKYGGAHAEAHALNNLDNDKLAKGATLYCNLEPCCHTNKQTPPCAQRIIKAEIKKIVIANYDPNPMVSGKAIKMLRESGIEVVTGVCEQEGLELNRIFFKNMQRGLPFIHIKVAQTLDGKMASLENDSKWISDQDARKQVHLLRQNYDAVAIGRNTQLADNPKLTVRLKEISSPYRIVFGDINKMNHRGHLFTDQFKEKTIVLTKTKPVSEQTNVKWIDINGLSLEEVFKALYRDFKITSILVEGGPTLLTSIIDQNLFDLMTVYINPILLGNGHALYKNEDNHMIKDALSFGETRWSVLNNQAVLEIHNVHRSH